MLASALTAACEQAKIDAAEWNDGDVIPWDGWTDAIARILAKAGLAHGLSKSEFTTSHPFVERIAALQELLPEEHRRHGDTRDGLVQALVRARSRMRETRKRRKERDGDTKRR